MGQKLISSLSWILKNTHQRFHEVFLELVSKELNHLAAILHVYAGGLNVIKKKKLLLFFKKKMEILLHF